MPRTSRAAGFTALETLFVVALIGVIAAIAIPMTGNQLGYLRLSGDARNLQNSLFLAKMRAAASFTQVRLYIDLGEKSFRIEKWDRSATPNDWKLDGGKTYLYSTDQFGYGSVSTPPPFTQVTIGQAPPCYTRTSALITNTACIVFNSRGVPISASGAPTATEPPIGTNAAYVTDSHVVYGATVSATGMIRLYRGAVGGTPSWTLQ
jgi:Tfp pilus assembly protein FimT